MREFISNFSEQFDETEKSLFTAATKFRDLEEWNSLIALSVIGMVDEQYDVQLKGKDIRNAQTIEELYNMVKSYLK
ncbi:MAG: acyl carrier protein [Tannerella sp.]|nr:acyl carrier protein [Tannerella sp.]